MLSIQTNDLLAVSANPTRVYSQTTRSRRNKRSTPPIMKNERSKPNNPTETRTTIARTQSTQTIFGTGDKRSAPDTGFLYPYKPAAAYISPPQRIPRVDEVESRGWGRRAPQSPSSSSFGAPQGNNKIYTYDVVFSPGEARIKSKEQHRFLIIKHRKSADCKS